MIYVHRDLSFLRFLQLRVRSMNSVVHFLTLTQISFNLLVIKLSNICSFLTKLPIAKGVALQRNSLLLQVQSDQS